MIKKILFSVLFFFLTIPAFAFFWNEREKPILIFTPYDILSSKDSNTEIKSYDVFKKNHRIYYYVYTKEGFKSNFIRYQIIKQDDKAHVGGYSRIRNGVKRVKNNNYYSDYFVLSEAGKYVLQIFDIEDSHHWIAYGHFRVIDE